MMILRTASVSLLLLSLVGCISQPQAPVVQQPTKVPEKPVIPKEIRTPTGVVIKPYEHEEIQRQQMPPKLAEQNIVIPPQKKEQQFDDGSQLPVFKNLIQQAETALQQNQVSNAENFALQAQRLAPQSAQTYLVLSKIALAKKDNASASSFVQRGLSLVQDEQTKQQLNHVKQQIK